MKTLGSKLLATCVVAGALAASPVQAANEISSYSVKDLLGSCMEGANDAREGAIDELVCDQYIRGVTDAVIALEMDKGLCLPKADDARSGDLSRAFIKWVYEDFERRSLPAGRGVMEMLMDKFACPAK
ncbi:MAG TPA: hypothetical protein ENJ35_04070 [Gammaproteobacteria bacterium]|nr:hypothetical protein [Gammaproteobacteria bacterium]